MGMEDIDYAPGGSVNKVTDYGIGLRGIDAIYVTQNGSTTANYPIYDAHGNMISTLSRQGTGNYSTSTLRTFDAWGQIRIGAQTGDPKGRYCANLGHKQDDESGLIYMRARFYESGSGRFINTDPVRQGVNFFVYCMNNPVDLFDSSGTDPWDASAKSQFDNWTAFGCVTFSIGVMLAMNPFGPPLSTAQLAASALMIAAAAGAFATAYGFDPKAPPGTVSLVAFAPWVMSITTGIAAAIRPASANAIARVGIVALGLYDTVMLGILIDISEGN